MSIELTKHLMNDGSRMFSALAESRSWSSLRSHLGSLTGVRLGEYLTDGVTEAWIDFTYRDHAFTINNQFGEFWFFSSDPTCPEDILTEITAHCQLHLSTEARASP